MAGEAPSQHPRRRSESDPSAGGHMIRRAHKGYALPAVLLFLTAVFGMWALVWHTSGSALRIEQARFLRSERVTWTASAAATGLRLLETGNPPTDIYECKVTLVTGDTTRYFRLRYEK